MAIIDVRDPQKYEMGFIRGSIDLNYSKRKSLETLGLNLIQIARKSAETENKYNLKKIRRFVVISDSQESSNEAFSFLKDYVKSRDLELEVDKIYTLTDKFSLFQNLFPFLVLTKIETVEADPVSEQKSLADKSELTAAQKTYLYSSSRFPTIISQGPEPTIFLGNIFNMNNGMQLRDLKIGQILHISSFPYSKTEEHPEMMKIEKSTKLERPLISVTLNLSKFIDFEDIFANIGLQPLLICCNDWLLGPAIAVAYLMWRYQWDVNRAGLVVFSKLGTTSVNPILYNQVLHYTPGNKVIKI